MKRFIFGITALTTTIANASFTFAWQGVIDYLYEAQIDAAPASIDLGSVITGTLQFERSGYDGYSVVQGNDSGLRYTFTDAFLLEFTAGSDAWRFSGSNLSLVWTNGAGSTGQLLESHATSENFPHGAFPGYAGDYNASFYIRDETDPLAFWDSMDLELAAFDAGQFTTGGGGAATFLENESGDLVDGYAFGFKVTSLSITSVPEPSCPAVFAGLALLVTAAGRHRGQHPRSHAA